MSTRQSNRGALAPLYLSGFTTAFGAHGVATALGIQAGGLGLALVEFGLILALYDVAEVVLKPVFGALSDRIGVKPVIVGGLIAFAIGSAFAIASPTPIPVALARLGQGAAASAFSTSRTSPIHERPRRPSRVWPKKAPALTACCCTPG